MGAARSTPPRHALARLPTGASGTTVAVAPSAASSCSPTARGEGLGARLVQRSIDHNRERWPQSLICIGAQAHLQGFYGALGFRLIGDIYLEDGIKHIHMLLDA